MPVTVEWGDEAKTFTVTRVVGAYEPMEIADSVDDIAALMDTVDHKVSVVVDFTGAAALPRGMISHMPAIARRMGHPNGSKILVIVGASRTLRALVDIFSTVYRKVYYVETLDEAARLLAEKHPAGV
jgi:hypothetical protein